MTGNPIDDFDWRTRNIPSIKVREACGSPGDQAWAKYRAECGISKKVKFLTLYESVILFVRVDWRQTCKDIGWEYVKVPNAIVMNDAAKLLFEQNKQGRLIARTQNLDSLASKGDKDWKSVVEMVSAKLGKSISERTVSRICDAIHLRKFSRRRMFTEQEVNLITREALRRQIRRQQQKSRAC